MKQKLSISIIFILALGAIYAGYAADNVANTKHNLGSSGTGTYTTTSTTQICFPCHIPHASPVIAAPLWNRTLTPQNYIMYNSSTFDMPSPSYPSTMSLLCLGCHDGVLSLEPYKKPAGEGGTWTWPNGDKIANTSSAYIGIDLSNDHPISVQYDTSKDPAFYEPVNGKVGNLPLYLTGGNLYVECATCHNPHDNTYKPLLRMSNSYSSMCTECHKK